MLTVKDVTARLRAGTLQPGRSYHGLGPNAVAWEYLRRCRESAACAGCNAPLDANDRVVNGPLTNICIACACG